MSELILQGRSSSHFTRTARIFALELDVAHVFRPVLDLASQEPGDYAGNPALKIPILIDASGPLFGAENICRELVRRSGRAASVVQRGDMSERIVANAEELTLHAMSAEVSIIMANASKAPVAPKLVRGLDNSLRYLDENIDALLACLPPQRAFSFVEVALFCLITHLPFRKISDVAPLQRLCAFAQRFAERPSARATDYRFDA